MRTIKFRSWLPEFNKMVYGQFGWATKSIAIGDAVCEKDLMFQNLMQFTGLHDKNGKEIYEGDIVIKIDENTLGYTRTRVCKVLWDKDGYWKILTTLGDGYAFSECYGATFEVIGNIYEDEELLTSE